MGRISFGGGGGWRVERERKRWWVFKEVPVGQTVWDGREWAYDMWDNEGRSSKRIGGELVGVR